MLAIQLGKSANGMPMGFNQQFAPLRKNQLCWWKLNLEPTLLCRGSMQKVVIQIEAHAAPSGCKHETLLKNNMYMKRQAANVDIAQ